MQLILVRHGKPARRDFDRPEGPPLSEEGHAQARGVAPRIRAEAPDALVSSPLTRAFETAQASAALLDRPLGAEPGVAEVDGEGVPYVFVEDIRAEGGEAWRNFLRDPIGSMGVDDAVFRARVRAGFASIVRAHEGAGKVAIFTHGFPINLMVGDAVGADLLAKLAPDYCSITRFRALGPDRFQLLSFNDTGHFGEAA